jgi:hypothetical protein
MTRWVLADFGEVISEPLPAQTIGELADLAGQPADEFRDRYWKFRPPDCQWLSWRSIIVPNWGGNDLNGPCPASPTRPRLAA